MTPDILNLTVATLMAWGVFFAFGYGILRVLKWLKLDSTELIFTAGIVSTAHFILMMQQNVTITFASGVTVKGTLADNCPWYVAALICVATAMIYERITTIWHREANANT